MKAIRKSLTLGALAAMALLASSCSAPTTELVADYPAYSSVDDLKAAADLIVEVEIGEYYYDLLLPVYEGDDPELNPYAGTGQKLPSPKDGAVPITVYEAVVRTSYVGHLKGGEILQIKQLGGEIDDTRIIVPEVKSLASGDTVLVFLQEFSDSPSSILGGDAGLFTRTETGTYVSVSQTENRLTVSPDQLTE